MRCQECERELTGPLGGHRIGCNLDTTDARATLADAKKDADSAPTAQFTVTTDQGTVREFKARTDQGDRYLRNMASRQIPTWEKIVKIEEVK